MKPADIARLADVVLHDEHGAAAKSRRAAVKLLCNWVRQSSGGAHDRGTDTPPPAAPATSSDAARPKFYNADRVKCPYCGAAKLEQVGVHLPSRNPDGTLDDTWLHACFAFIVCGSCQKFICKAR